MRRCRDIATRAVVTAVLAAVLVVAGLPGAPVSPAAAYPEAPWFQPDTAYGDNFPDPFVFYDGATGKYYAYATNTGGPLLPVMVSDDLVTWTARSAYSPNPYNGDPFFNDAMPAIPTYVTVDWVDTYHGRNMSEIQAPGVARFGSTYVAYLTLRCPVPGGFRRCIGVATAASPIGPFTPDNSGPLVRDDAAGGVIDPSPFTDPATGKTYLLWKTEGVPGTPTRLWSRELNAAGTGFAGGSATNLLLQTTEPSWQGSVIENPAMVAKDGWYYLVYSGNFWYSKDYAVGYAVCWGPAGPCFDQSPGAPWVGNRFDRIGRGGATPFLDAGGNLQLAYHAWNAPYVNYPTLTDAFAVVACGEPSVPAPFTVPSSCPWQGQRRLYVEPFSRNGDGSLAPPTPLAVPSLVSVPDRRYHSITPYRLIDTRNLSAGMANASAVKPDGGWVIPLEVHGRGRGAWDGPDRVPPSGVSAVALNLTVTEGDTFGYITAFPCGATVPEAGAAGATSSLNFATNQVIPNMAIAQLGIDGKVCLYVEQRTQVIVDLVGYYDGDAAGSLYSPVAPTRILDSRPGAENLAWATPLAPGETRSLTVAGASSPAGVPATATAVVMNMTVTGPTAPGDLRVWPAGAPQPDASNLNWAPGETVPNLVIAKVGAGGQVSVRNSSGTTHVIADVVGYHSPAGALTSTVSPARVLDTRFGIGSPVAPIGADESRVVSVAGGGVPVGATAVIVNLTAVHPNAPTHLTAYAGDQVTPPTASNLNVVPGDVRANLAVVPLAADRTIRIRNNSGAVDVLADVVGYVA